MNIPLLTTPLFRSSHIVVVWDCKNRFFCIHCNTLAHFFLFFCIFYAILLCISEIKLHFPRFSPPKNPFFAPFSPLSCSPEGEIFADFRKISAKIEFRQPSNRSNFGVIIYKLLIYCIIHILALCILLYFRYLHIITVLF